MKLGILFIPLPLSLLQPSFSIVDLDLNRLGAQVIGLRRCRADQRAGREGKEQIWLGDGGARVLDELM